MATRPHTLHLAALRVGRWPGSASWALALLEAVALSVALIAAYRAGERAVLLSAAVLLLHAWLALAAAVILQRMRSMRRVLRDEMARLLSDYGALRRQTAAVAHDMRAPLVTVNSYLELLAAGEFGPLPAAAKVAAERATRASTRSRMLVDATLAASLGERSETRAPAVLVDLNAVLSDVILSLGADITRSHALVSVGSLPPVRGSEAAYYRIFENLVQNGLRYAKSGTAPRVQIVGSERAYGVDIAVRDDGRGIREDERERVFLERVRGSNAAGQGSGLGLATVRDLVTSLGGSVWIDPDLADGTCVRVRFPLAIGASTPAR